MPSQTLSLSQSQQMQMILAPQLRQSLEMLQLPILELRTQIQEELEKNPTLEETSADNQTIEIEPTVAENTDESKVMDFSKEEYEALAKLDEEWRDYFFQDANRRPFNQDDAEKRQFMLDSLPQTESLQEHLLNQLNLAGLSESDHQIGELILGSLNEDGYLSIPLDELAASGGFDKEHVETILAIVQDFDPIGIAARDLRECLLIQLERMGHGTSVAAEVVKNHIAMLGERKITEIARAMNADPEEVLSAQKIIASLNPKPGRQFSSEVSTYVLPEVVVQKVDGEYQIALNDEQLPRLRISSHYRQLIESDSTSAEVKSYIRERIRSGAFLIKSIHQRQKTIYRIASEIVSLQKDFLDHGVSHLRPLTMAAVAKTVGVHETTVSRAVSGKYMQSPLGLFELRYFFTSGIKTTDGGEMSNKTIRDIISQLVAKEDTSSPLSDQELMAMLEAKGIPIARRTIAKYRHILRIPPSHQRKI
jgi:RNA polymerase sigma-54 factor